MASLESLEDIEFLDKLSAPGFIFPMQDTDNMLNLRVNDKVNFGDIKDVVEAGTAIEVDPNRPTVRRFVPGIYTISVIKPCKDHAGSKLNDPLVIFHHEDVDPNLVALQVIRMSEDYSCDYENIPNTLGRRDWCHWTHYEEHIVFQGDVFDEDFEHLSLIQATSNAASAGESAILKAGLASQIPIVEGYPPQYRTVIYFVRREDAKDLQHYLIKNQVRRSSVNKYMFFIYDNKGAIVALGINYSPFSTHEWLYAKTFEDSETQAVFTLVINGNLSLEYGPWNDLLTPEQRKARGFTTVRETELKFKMSEFLKK